jgi:hypothetical protein
MIKVSSVIHVSATRRNVDHLQYTLLTDFLETLDYFVLLKEKESLEAEKPESNTITLPVRPKLLPPWKPLLFLRGKNLDQISILIYRS